MEPGPIAQTSIRQRATVERRGMTRKEQVALYSRYGLVVGLRIDHRDCGGASSAPGLVSRLRLSPNDS
jgi:hypothetical protein